MQMLDNFSIRGKNRILLGLVALTLVLALWGTIRLVNNSLQDQSRHGIQDLTGLALDIVHASYDLQQQGVMNEEQARAHAIAALRDSRYAGDGYFFVFENGVCRLLPFLPEKEGSDMSGMTDKNGVRVVQELTREGRNPDGGFVDYVWPHPASGKVAPKVSVARHFEPWNWTIGTGIYQTDLNSTILALIRHNLPTVASMLVCFFLLVFVISRINHSSLARIDGVKNHLSKFAMGDFSNRIRVSGDDEIGQMLASLRQVQEQMQRVVHSLRSTTGQVRDGMVEIAEANQDLAVRTERQSSNLAASNQHLQSLADIVRDNSVGVMQARGCANDARNTAERGSQAMSSVVAAMSAITESSTQVNDIVDVIDGIAFQTNLLALNAAVEAARAGEQGRGFAVVASEVRALAQRSAESAAQIKALIEKSGEAVRDGAGMVSNSEQILDEIVSSTTQVRELLEQVAAAAEDQNRGIGQTRDAVAELDSFMQQNAAMVQQVAVSSRNLVAEADDLAQEIAFFTVENGNSDAFASPLANRANGLGEIRSAAAF